MKEVCPMSGCWIQIFDESIFGRIRVKITDGEIIFSKSEKNRIITVEDTFVTLDLSKKQAVNWKLHLEAEKGIELNPNDIVLKEQYYLEYRFNCTGLVFL